MRPLADAERLRRFMQALGSEATAECRVYFTGGATAVLEGWRRQTIDADIRFVPDSDSLLQAIPHLKESLEINVELASPADFIPELPGWQDRSRFIAREGRVSFFHYDFYAQALAKIERGERKDLVDVNEMLARGLVERARAWALFREIEPRLYRYPAIDPAEFRRSVAEALGPEPPPSAR
jgi:hypothetical protein